MPTVGTDVQVEFLNLLVVQLQNQDPLEPVKQEQFISQLTEISTLSAVEDLNTNFTDLLKVQELSQAASLAGKDVRYLQDGAVSIGRVSEITVVGDATEAVIDGQTVALGDILSVIG